MSYRRSAGAGRFVVLSLGLLMLTLLVFGCAGRVDRNVPSFHDTGAGTIAVMPVVDHSGNDLAVRLLREKLIDAVHFKGYRRIPSRVVDAALASGNKGAVDGDAVLRTKQTEAIGVDAFLKVNLQEASIKEGSFHVTTAIRVTMELVAADSGLVLWRADERDTATTVAVTQQKRQQAAHMVFETLMDGVVARAFSTFPEGPILTPGETPDRRGKGKP